MVHHTPHPWMVSLHGGHSSDFCDHAQDPLRAMLGAAVAAGYHTFGVSEHVPRGEERFLYAEERRRGWDVAKTKEDFRRYTAAIQQAAVDFADRLIVLRGFEAEVVPTGRYADRVRSLRALTLSDGSPAFDYFVGSVHYVNELSIDGEVPEFLAGVELAGSLERLAVAYYEQVAEMALALQPPVVGHFDLIKKRVRAAGLSLDDLQKPAVLEAAGRAMEAVRACGGILDLNTAGWRKGLGEPYPAPWAVRLAAEMGVPFCFGDDSHCIADVGAGVPEAREYLLANGVTSVTVLTKDAPSGPVVRREVPLD